MKTLEGNLTCSRIIFPLDPLPKKSRAKYGPYVPKNCGGKPHTPIWPYTTPKMVNHGHGCGPSGSKGCPNPTHTIGPQSTLRVPSFTPICNPTYHVPFALRVCPNWLQMAILGHLLGLSGEIGNFWGGV